MHHHENASHNHNHNHSHDHDHDHRSQTNKDRIQKMITHWLKHNDDHIKNYLDWSEKAKDENLQQLSDLLKDIADISLTLNEKFKQALNYLE
jgi:G3E family GTPase